MFIHRFLQVNNMTQTKVTIITAAVMIGILLIGAITILVLSDRQEKRELAASDAAGALTSSTTNSQYTDFAGNPANLDQYLGQVLVVTSWASWSPFSSAELTLLAEVAETYTEDGVIVIAINRAEAKSVAESYLRTIGVSDQVKLIVDSDDRYYRSIDGYTMPETVFYDRKGNVVVHQRGRLTNGEAVAYIEQVLSRE